MSDVTVPTCGVVVEKEGDVVCSNLAIDLTSIVNPDNHTQVMAVVLTCEKHSKDLSEGKMLMFKSEDGEHIAVQYQVEESTNVS